MLFTNVMNLSLTIVICLLYLYRTYNMCQFDKEPVWLFIPDVGSDEEYLEKFDDFAESHCTAQSHTWYYHIILPITHTYFLLEFIFRALV